MRGVFLVKRLRIYLSAFSLFVTFLYPVYPCFGSSSQQNSEKDLINGAKKEGKLVVYHSATVQDMSELFDGFKKKYPFLTIEGYRAGSDTIINKSAMEARVGRHVVDIFTLRGSFALPLKQKNLLLKYYSPESSMIPEGLKDPEGYWIAYKTVSQVVAYNTKLVKREELPKSLSGFISPRWKGQIAMDELSGEWYQGVMNYLGPNEGLRVMKGLAQQDIVFRRGRTLLVELLCAGEHAAMIGASDYAVEQRKEKGAPIDWAEIEPIVWIPDIIGMASHSPHPNAAKLFVDFSLSREGQEINVKVGRTPSRMGITGRYKRLTEVKKFPLDPNLDNSPYEKQFRQLFIKNK